MMKRLLLPSIVGAMMGLILLGWPAALLAQSLPAPSSAEFPQIHDIQGRGHGSDLEGVVVKDVPGIVTQVTDTGFYLQDPQPDEDEATSEGLFIFTRTPPTDNLGEAIAVGDAVQVSGQVAEYTPGQGNERATNLSVTQIVTTDETASIVRTATGNPLPPPVVIGQAGRLPPNRMIEDDGFTRFDPDSDGLDFYESLEGMRVQIDQALVVNPAGKPGGVIVVGDNGAHASILTILGGLVIQDGDFNPERIYIRSTVGRNPSVKLGDRFDGALVGVMGYSTGSYKVFLTEPLPRIVAGDRVAEVTELASGADQLTLAAFNLENLAPGDRDRFAPIANTLVTNLNAPDIVALIEVQDNNGPSDQGDTDATQTYQQLIQAIQTAGGPTYQFTDIAPIKGQDGGQAGGNIRVGYLFQPGRVALADRPKGSATDAVQVVAGATGPRLSLNPGRIDPGNRAFANSRKPLAAEFLFNGQSVFVVAGHFNSKRGDGPLFGQQQPPVFSTEVQRQQQAQVVHQFVDQLLAQDANANVIVLGDLNDFQFSRPLQILAQDALVNLTDLLPASDRYTYLFEGNSQQLDHALVSQHPLFEGKAEFDIVHLNVGFPNAVSDHDPIVVRLTLPAGVQPGGNPTEPPTTPTDLGAVPTESPITPPSDVAPGTLPEGVPEIEPEPGLFISILPDLKGSSLISQLRTLYAPRQSLGYDQARTLMYSVIDNQEGVVTGIYTGYQITLNPNAAANMDAFAKGINAEHVWPQSKGATGSAKSDLHHLFPSLSRVNAIRGNLPFGEIVDAQTQRWLRQKEELKTIPTALIEEYSEAIAGQFEPREIKKGDVARAIFYFYTMYPSQADTKDARFFPVQQKTLCQWHQLDPVDGSEVERSHAIARSRQGNENPFVLDPTLVQRTYCSATF